VCLEPTITGHGSGDDDDDADLVDTENDNDRYDDNDDNDNDQPRPAGTTRYHAEHLECTPELTDSRQLDLPHLSNKKLSYRRGTARRGVSVGSVLNVAQMFVELHLISPALHE